MISLNSTPPKRGAGATAWSEPSPNTEAEITQGMADLTEHMTLLDDSMKQLEELNPQCIDTGMSYADRVAKREEEIEALKKAMCILDTDKVEADC